MNNYVADRAAGKAQRYYPTPFSTGQGRYFGECHAHLILTTQCSGRDFRKNKFGVNCELIGEIRQQPRGNLAENSFRDFSLYSHLQ